MTPGISFGVPVVPPDNWKQAISSARAAQSSSASAWYSGASALQRRLGLAVDQRHPAGAAGEQLTGHRPWVEAVDPFGADVGLGLGEAAETADLMLAMGGEGEHRAYAELEQGEAGLDEGDAVGQVQHYRVAMCEAGLAQSGCRTAAALEQVGIAEPLVVVAERDPPRMARGAGGQGFGEVLVLPVASVEIAADEGGGPVGGVVDGRWGDGRGSHAISVDAVDCHCWEMRFIIIGGRQGPRKPAPFDCGAFHSLQGRSAGRFVHLR